MLTSSSAPPCLSSFWNYHEDVKGTRDYQTESRNLREFLQAAQDAGLFVNLRIGPYGQRPCDSSPFTLHAALLLSPTLT